MSGLRVARSGVTDWAPDLKQCMSGQPDTCITKVHLMETGTRWTMDTFLQGSCPRSSPLTPSNPQPRSTQPPHQVTKINNFLKINDWTGIEEQFDELAKRMEAKKALVEREGIPRFYIKTLATLEDQLAAIKEKVGRTCLPWG